MHHAASAIRSTLRESPSSLSWLVFFSLVLVGFAAHYLLLDQFGIYEDDYFFTTPAYSWSADQMFAHVADAWRSWPQFRPLGFSLTHLVTWVTAQSESLTPAYLSGLGIQSLNAWLLYVLIARHTLRSAAFIAAAIFLLYPTDTGRTILMLRAFQHLNLTFILTALILYSYRRPTLALIVSSCSLLIYEHFYLGMLVAPLLVTRLNPIDWLSFLRRYALLALPPLILLVSRYFVGDSRAGDVVGSPLDAAGRSLQAMVIGPKTTFLSLLERPLDALRHSDGTQWTIIIAVAVLVAFVSWILRRTETALVAENNNPRALVTLGFLALGCLSASYVLAIRPDNFPPVVNLGRLSGFNSPGSIACVLAIAALLSALLQRMRRGSVMLLGAGAVYVGLLASFGYEVQRADYARHWDQQRNVWEAALKTSPEWNEGTPIIIDMDSGDGSNFQTAGFPVFWLVTNAPWGIDAFTKRPPSTSGSPHSTRTFGFTRGLGFTEENGAVKLHTPPQNPALRPRIADSQFILFTFQQGGLVRSDAPWTVKNQSYLPKPLAATDSHAPATLSELHDILFLRPRSKTIPASKWPSYTSGRNYPQ
jgi:hypothetical protein